MFHICINVCQIYVYILIYTVKPLYLTASTDHPVLIALFGSQTIAHAINTIVMIFKLLPKLTTSPLLNGPFNVGQMSVDLERFYCIHIIYKNDTVSLYIYRGQLKSNINITAMQPWHMVEPLVYINVHFYCI